MPKPLRTAAATAADATARCRTAEAYLELARIAADDETREQYRAVAVGNAVLSGIAASDAICAKRLGEIHRGDDHRGATDLLKTAAPDGSSLSKQLSRLLDLKDKAHYGVPSVSRRDVTTAMRAAEELVERSRQEVER